MKEISAALLKLVHSIDPLPTVEVDLDSIPERLFGYGDLVAKALHLFAASFPQTTATVYVYQGPSVNFHEQTFSAFFGVAGQNKKALLESILRAFREIPGVKARMSDYIDSANTFSEYHIENGSVWRPLDAATWFSDSATIKEKGELDTEEMASGQEDLGAEKQNARPPAARLRAARSDTTIGLIVKKIEALFGLPNGSVVLLDHEGKRMRSDAKIATLRKRWDR